MRNGFAMWITGFPGSGKTTIAKIVLEILKKKGITAMHLESDALRRILTPEPDYSVKERDWFYSVVVFMGTLLTENGVNVIFDATANRKEYREKARAAIPRFIEVYVRCPLQICIERDPKGIYAKARAGGSTTVPGIQEPYEEPEHADVLLNSDQIPAEVGAERIVSHLNAIGWI